MNPSCPTCSTSHFTHPVEEYSKVYRCDNCLHTWTPHRNLSNPARVQTGWVNIVLSVN